MFDFILMELVSYGVLPWLLFISITVIAAYTFDFPGIILGHFLIALTVLILDIAWIQSAMRNPNWDSNFSPDQDFIFYIGVFLRILFINSVLLPASEFSLIVRCIMGWICKSSKQGDLIFHPPEMDRFRI